MPTPDSHLSAPLKPPNLASRYKDNLQRRVMPFHVPRAPPRGKVRFRRIGQVALQKYTRRTKRLWARKTNRQRKLQALKTEKMREQPYQVSRLVLDLDGVDCPGVRPYSKQDEVQQRNRWRANPELRALFRRMIEVRREIDQSKIKWRAELRRYDPRRITERDILAVAFLGVPRDTDVASDAQLTAQAPPLGYVTRDFFDSMGVTDRITDDVHHTVHTLLHRLRHQPLLAPVRSARCQEEFVDELDKTDNVAFIERMVAPLLQTDWGRSLLSKCRDKIVFNYVRANQLMLDERVYQFLQNISVGLRADGHDFNFPSGALIQQLESRLAGGRTMA